MGADHTVRHFGSVRTMACLVTNDFDVEFALKESSMNEKRNMEKKLQLKLEEWKAELSKLNAQAESAGSELQDDFQKRLFELERKILTAQEQLNKLRSASGSAWEEMTQAIDRAWQEIDETIKKTKDQFTK